MNEYANLNDKDVFLNSTWVEVIQLPPHDIVLELTWQHERDTLPILRLNGILVSQINSETLLTYRKHIKDYSFETTFKDYVLATIEEHLNVVNFCRNRLPVH